MLRLYSDLTKFGIVIFALVSAMAGFAVSFPVGEYLDMNLPLLLVVGLYFLSAGSFSINQAQEYKIDRRMDRTAKRPVATGIIQPWQAYLIGVIYVLVGSLCLYVIQPMTAILGLLTVFLYNGPYTLWWKRHLAFGAVPGAIPGAMPVVIGYSVNDPNVFNLECLYLFTVMFLWQMPHFWCLAIRYKEDYRKGSIPVLPLKIGDERTRYHIGLYTLAYAGIAVSAPLLLNSHLLSLLIVFPMAFKLIYEFFRYYQSQEAKAWLPFFLWVNLSVLVFLGVPAVERWMTYFYFLYF